MAGGVQVTRLDRFDHQLQQFLVRALQSEVYGLNLSQSEKWNPERSSGDSAVRIATPTMVGQLGTTKALARYGMNAIEPRAELGRTNPRSSATTARIESSKTAKMSPEPG